MGFKVGKRFAIEVVREVKETNVLEPDHLKFLNITYKVCISTYYAD